MKFNTLMPELYVTDFNKSLDFYANILGFTLEYQRTNPQFAFLSYQGSQLMIQQLAPGEKEEMKLAHPFGRGINFEIKTVALAHIIESLKKCKYPISRGVKESWRYVGKAGFENGSQEILVHDPDGYLLRFSQSMGERNI